MTADEYRRWLAELVKRLPDTGVWILNNADTSRIWFEEIFSGLDYDVCMSALSQLWHEGVKAYDRERIPSIVMKKHGEILWHRSAAQRRAEESRKNVGGGFFTGSGEHCVSMRHGYMELVKLLKMDVQGPGFVDQYFDLAADDPERCDTAEAYIAKYKLEIPKHQQGEQ